MKLAGTVIVLGVLFYVFASVGGVEYMANSITIEGINFKVEQLQGTFDPAWNEKFQKADLLEKLQAVSGESLK